MQKKWFINIKCKNFIILKIGKKLNYLLKNSLRKAC